MLSLVVLLLPFTVDCQINLGQFNMAPGPNGLWDLGFNQGGSLMGFGGDRGFNARVGQGTFGLTGSEGAVVGGERVGTATALSSNKAGALNYGSNLNFGNGAPSATPTGDFNSFLEGIKAFFARLAPPPVSTPSPFIAASDERPTVLGLQPREAETVRDLDAVHPRREAEEREETIKTHRLVETEEDKDQEGGRNTQKHLPQGDEQVLLLMNTPDEESLPDSNVSPVESTTLARVTIGGRGMESLIASAVDYDVNTPLAPV